MRRRGGNGLWVIVGVFGLLLWARLLLITNHPRTAIAEPPAAAAPEPSTVPAIPDPEQADDGPIRRTSPAGD